jgi:Haem-dependent oxidative N-demethylase, alpha subunit-like
MMPAGRPAAMSGKPNQPDNDREPNSRSLPGTGVRTATGEDGTALLPDADYGFQMRFQRGPTADFFRPWGKPPDLLAQRRRWLQGEPAAYAAALPESKPLFEEMVEQAQNWGLTNPFPHGAEAISPGQTCLALGERLEPDFLLLRPAGMGSVRLLAGCVCFPSSWSLAEKMGRPIEDIHSVVPGLNPQLGPPIASFLRRIPPGPAWLRANWGLSRSTELNQHPARRLPRLDAGVELDEVWLRIEHQALVALPRTGGVLFGIRIAVHPLATIQRNSAAHRGLIRALRTMPEAMAAYKGLAEARTRLLEVLSELPEGDA